VSKRSFSWRRAYYTEEYTRPQVAEVTRSRLLFAAAHVIGDIRPSPEAGQHVPLGPVVCRLKDLGRGSTGLEESATHDAQITDRPQAFDYCQTAAKLNLQKGLAVLAQFGLQPCLKTMPDTHSALRTLARIVIEPTAPHWTPVMYPEVAREQHWLQVQRYWQPITQGSLVISSAACHFSSIRASTFPATYLTGHRLKPALPSAEHPMAMPALPICSQTTGSASILWRDNSTASAVPSSENNKTCRNDQQR
jgi:hypothetical protein